MTTSSPASPSEKKVAGTSTTARDANTNSTNSPSSSPTPSPNPYPHPHPYSSYPYPGPIGPTAYPYPYAAAPTPSYYPTCTAPPQQFYPSPYYAASGNQNHLTFMHRFLCILIFLLTMSTVFTFFVYIALSPRLPEISVSAASISGLDASEARGQVLSGQFNITFTIHNRSGKMAIVYDMVTAAIFYKGEAVGETSLPPFEQDKGNDTSVNARIVVVDEYVGKDVVRGINAEKGKGDGSVSFEFGLYAWVKYEAGMWGTRRQVMKAYCEEVHIGFNGVGVGSLVGSEIKCQVQI